MFFADRNCLAVGAAVGRLHAGGLVPCTARCCREPPTATAWSHYAVQAVVLFPTARAATDFFEARSRTGRAARTANSPTPAIGPEQVWSVGQISSTDHDVPRCPREGAEPKRWSPAGPLTVQQSSPSMSGVQRRPGLGGGRDRPPDRRPDAHPSTVWDSAANR